MDDHKADEKRIEASIEETRKSLAKRETRINDLKAQLKKVEANLPPKPRLMRSPRVSPRPSREGRKPKKQGSRSPPRIHTRIGSVQLQEQIRAALIDILMETDSSRPGSRSALASRQSGASVYASRSALGSRASTRGSLGGSLMGGSSSFPQLPHLSPPPAKTWGWAGSGRDTLAPSWV